MRETVSSSSSSRNLWNRHGRARIGNGRDLLPTAGTRRRVRIINMRRRAVVPIWRGRRQHDFAGRGNDQLGRFPRTRVGIDGLWIVIPARADDPPPAGAAAVNALAPMTGAPNAPVMFLEAADVAAPMGRTAMMGPAIVDTAVVRAAIVPAAMMRAAGVLPDALWLSTSRILAVVCLRQHPRPGASQQPAQHYCAKTADRPHRCTPCTAPDAECRCCASKRPAYAVQIAAALRWLNGVSRYGGLRKFRRRARRLLRGLSPDLFQDCFPLAGADRRNRQAAAFLQQHHGFQFRH
jgi:hypothetical protein